MAVLCEGVLSPSSYQGKYAVGERPFDLLRAMVCEVFLAGRWVRGVVRHSHVYPCGMDGMVVHKELGAFDTYYLALEDEQGETTLCGLCVGMRVRVLDEVSVIVQYEDAFEQCPLCAEDGLPRCQGHLVNERTGEFI